MDLEKQFCTREQAEKLISLGVRNQVMYGEFYYSYILSDGKEIKAYRTEGESAPPKMFKPVRLYSVAELGEMMPVNSAMPYKNAAGKWINPDSGGITHLEYETEAEARAAAVIHLKENAYVK